jgi:DNA-directed RNA polymerase specialized sigma24 family protein
LNTEANDVTKLLIRWRDGDEDVSSQLMPLVCEELRRLTGNYLQRDRIDCTSQLASPVREAYLRMVDASQATEQDRARFYVIAAREMRRVLVERAHDRTENGNGEVNLRALDGALKSFAQTYPRKSDVVELKFFGGLETQEISELLQVSEKTVLRDWNFAKLWPCRALSNAA